MVVIDPAAVANFRRYGLTPLIARHAANRFPWEFGAALVEIECGGDPHAYNYYDDGGALHRAHWNPGDPLPDGADGRPQAYAVGATQIIARYPRGLSLAERFDPEQNVAAVFAELGTYWRQARTAGLSGHDLAASVYVAHNRGPVPFHQGLARRPKTVHELVSFSELPVDVGARAVKKALEVAEHMDGWAALKVGLGVTA